MSTLPVVARSPLWFVVYLFGGLMGLTGCSSAPDLDPPEGWVSDTTVTGEVRWWQEGIDTSSAFRSLDGLRDMQIVGIERSYEETAAVLASGRAFEIELSRAVKQSLARLYRANPEVVDSLFNAHVDLSEESLGTGESMDDQVETSRTDAYTTLRRHFREPRTQTSLGTDVPVVYPDSLRSKGIGGRVRMQVYLDTSGVPQALELITPVHPVLDKLALQATTQMRWLPPYVLRKRQWHPLNGWTRYQIQYGNPQG